jgi:hypothetical protein
VASVGTTPELTDDAENQPRGAASRANPPPMQKPITPTRPVASARPASASRAASIASNAGPEPFDSARKAPSTHVALGRRNEKRSGASAR